MNTPYRNSVLLVALLVAIALAPGAAIGVVSQPAGGDVAPQQGATNASANASVTMTNQTRTGRSVFIDRATLPEGGFVVLSEAGDNGSVIGVSLPLAPGTHEGKVTLRGVPGSDLNHTSLGANTTLVATLYRDSNDNSRFDGLLESGTDEPYMKDASPVADRATVTIADGERPTNASVTLSNGTTNGTRVTVDRATLAEGGYVAIHEGGYNGSNATETLVGATGYLDAGSYANVTVSLGNDSTLTDSGRISAVVYEDTDGDRAFQYVQSDGIEDQPALENGTAVADTASLTVEHPSTPTPTPTDTPTPTVTDTSTPTDTSTAAPTDTPTPPQDVGDESTPYGGESSGREGILENPLFPVLVGVFALFAVLAVVGR
ncbi:DUF7282 domain-containing protein [Halococcus sp. AFM35]|uniref:DUF7282 domain-containing protein n=1 Tax=Halococcus sp. AFM35 TaxID=3421653 RepID=UPI003EC06DFD